MRQGNKLNSLAVRSASAPGLYGDGHGLYLQVSKFGTKSWVFRYMIDGVPRKMGLGALHTVSLAEARKRAAEARLQVHDRLDPIGERKASRGAARLAAARAVTFKECADRYIEANRPGWRNPKHADQWYATFNETRHGERKFPATTAAINDLPVAAIDRALVLSVLKPIWHEKPETASRVRGRIESVLSFATVSEYRSGENPARWRGHLDQLLPARGKIARVKHHDAIPYAEIPNFMAELRGKDSVYRPGARVHDPDGRAHRRGGRRPMGGIRPRREGLDRSRRANEAGKGTSRRHSRIARCTSSRRCLAPAISCSVQGPIDRFRAWHAAVHAPHARHGRDRPRLPIDVPRLGGGANRLSERALRNGACARRRRTRSRPPTSAAT